MTVRNAILAAALLCAAGSTAMARPFIPGNLVVSRVGDGSAALGSAATPAFLMEFTTAGASVGTLGMPTSAAGPNRQFTLSGTATSEGFLTRSADGRYLTIGGYDASVGTASITGSNSGTINRVLGRVDDGMVIDTSTVMSETGSPGNIRSACSNDGSGFWVGNSAGGVRYVPYGGVASTQLSTTITNTRVTNIFAGQLYVSSATGAFQGVSTVGTGLPTSSGQSIVLLPGMPTAAGPSSYDYFFADANTLYVADDRSAASGGGIQKWVFSGAWSLSYTIPLGATTAGGARGLTGIVDGAGVATLYATTTESAANRLVSVTDIGAGSAFSVLATAGSNTAFRGVDFAPVPTPGTLGLLSIAGLFAARRRR